MTIAIIDRSEPAGLRIGSQVSGIKGVRSIIQIIDKEKILETLEKVQPQVVIFDLNGNNGKHFSNLQEIRASVPKAMIIALTSFSLESYCRKCNEIGVKHCLDKVHEFDRIPELITGWKKNKTQSE